MNVKTTVALAFFLVVAVFALVVLRSQPTAPAGAAPVPSTPVTARDLIEDKLGEVIRVEVKRKNHDDQWVFERVETDQGMTGEWRMTAPLDTKAIRWEVDRIPRQLTSLRYEISYGPGEAGGVSPADAGLDPPHATVKLTDRDGKTATIEIGKPASASTTYVRLAGSDRVCVGKASLNNLFKSKAIAYRDNQPWTFKPNEVKQLEIVDRSGGDTRTYAFIPVGSDWRMTAPVSAKATDKVAGAVQTLSILRAGAWVDDDAGKLAIYGLDQAPIAIHVTVEQEVKEPKKKKDDKENESAKDEKEQKEPDDAAPKTRTTVYDLYLSDRGPIGEETKVYFRVGDPPIVGTIAKTIADKLRPVMGEWRDMHVADVDVPSATTGIDLNIEGQALKLARRDGTWWIDPGNEHAEGKAVKRLLTALADLKATAFVDGTVAPEVTGLDKPRATIALTLPNADAPVRVLVGNPTDQTTKLLSFLRFGVEGPLAKVRSSDVEPLLQTPLVYRDRTIFNLAPSKIQRLTFSVKAPFAEKPLHFAIARSDDSTWSMVEPVQAPVRTDAVTKLVSALATLHAERVVASTGQETGYGLDDPAVRLSIQMADDSTYDLVATQHDAGYYARRRDKGSIFEIAGSFYAQLRAELREEAVFSFDAANVTSFGVRHGDTEYAFTRKDDGWVYGGEPDLPLDAKKVEDLLLRIRDLKTERFVRYDAAANEEVTGLNDPERTITVDMKDGTHQVLLVSGQGAGAGAPPGRLARVSGQPGVFILSNEMLSRAVVSLDALAAR